MKRTTSVDLIISQKKQNDIGLRSELIQAAMAQLKCESAEVMPLFVLINSGCSPINYYLINDVIKISQLWNFEFEKLVVIARLAVR